MAKAPTARLTVRELPDTPSAQIIKDAKREIDLPADSQGRVITLAKPSVLGQFRLVKMLGQSAQNQAYMNMILPLIYVKAIDGEAQPFPNSEREIEALIVRLDEEGVANVGLAVMKHFHGVEIGPDGQLRSVDGELEASKESIKK
jgi:hypothetical protein